MFICAVRSASVKNPLKQWGHSNLLGLECIFRWDFRENDLTVFPQVLHLQVEKSKHVYIHNLYSEQTKSSRYTKNFSGNQQFPCLTWMSNGYIQVKIYKLIFGSKGKYFGSIFYVVYARSANSFPKNKTKHGLKCMFSCNFGTSFKSIQRHSF